MPAAWGTWAPTMPLAPMRPSEGSTKCIEPPLPLAKPGALPSTSADGALGVHAAGEGVVMAAVGAGEIVSLAQSPGGAHGAAFMADGGMHGAADLAGLGQFEERFLDAADKKHGAVHALAAGHLAAA